MSTVGELSVAFALVPQGWDKAASLIDRVRNAMRVFIAGEAVRGVATLVQRTAEAANHLYSMSQAAGVTTGQMQQLEYVSQQSGSNMRELTMGLSMFIGNMRRYVAGGGSKQFQRDMAEIGISQAEAARALKSPDGMMATLMKVSDHLKKIGKDGNAAGIGRELFGARSGRALVADLSRGSEAVQELMARRRAMGILTTDQVTSMRDLDNRIRDVKQSFGALAMTVVADLAPGLIKLAEGAARWIAANRDLITGALKAAIEGVAAAFSAVGAVVSELADLIHSAMNGSTGAQALVIGLAVAISTVLVPALIAMAAPIVAATLPLLAISAVVAAIAYAVLELVEHWDEVKKALGDAAEYALAEWRKFGQWVTDEINALLNFIDGIGDDIVGVFESVGEGIKNAFKAAIDWVEGKLRGLADAITSLPVVSQLIDAGHAIGRYAAGSGDDGADHSDEGDSPEAYERRRQLGYKFGAAPTVNVATGSQGAGTVTAPAQVVGGGGTTYAPVTNINVTATDDGHGHEIARKVGDILERRNRQAAAALSR